LACTIEADAAAAAVAKAALLQVLCCHYYSVTLGTADDLRAATLPLMPSESHWQMVSATASPNRLFSLSSRA
jgi:hypothetical protein